MTNLDQIAPVHFQTLTTAQLEEIVANAKAVIFGGKIDRRQGVRLHYARLALEKRG